MANQFGYTASTAGAGQVAVTSGKLKGLGSDIDALFKGVQVYQQATQKQDFYSASSAYRERQTQYLQGVDQVKHDPQAYAQHLENFRTDVRGLSEGLEGQQKHSFEASAGNFLMYQDMDLNRSQERMQKKNFTDKLDTSSHMFATMGINDIEPQLAELREEGKLLGLTPNEIEDHVFSTVNNIKVLSATDDDMTIEGLREMQKDLDKVEEIYPYMKGKKSQQTSKNRLKTILNGKLRVEEAKYNEAYRLSDETVFGEYLNRMSELEVFDPERVQLEANNWYKKELSSTATANKVLEADINKSGGRILLENYTGKQLTSAKQYVTSTIQNAFVGQDGMPDIETLKFNSLRNPDMFKKTMSSIVGTTVLATSAILSNPNADPKDIQQAKVQLQKSRSVMENFRNSVSKEDRSELNTALAISTIPDAKVQQQAWTTWNKKEPIKSLGSKNEYVKTTIEDMVDDRDKIDATKELSTLIGLGITPKIAVESVKENYKKTEIGDLKVNHRLSNYLPKNEDSYANFSDTLLNYIGENRPELVDSYMKIADNDGELVQDRFGHIGFKDDEGGYIIFKEEFLDFTKLQLDAEYDATRLEEAGRTTKTGSFADEFGKRTVELFVPVTGEEMEAGGVQDVIPRPIPFALDSIQGAVDYITSNVSGGFATSTKILKDTYKTVDDAIYEWNTIEDGQPTPKMDKLIKKIKEVEEVKVQEQIEQVETKEKLDKSPINIGKVKEHLQLREGNKDHTYLDSRGLPTAGIGHLLSEEEKKKYPVGTVIPRRVRDEWYEKDTTKAIKSAEAQAIEFGRPELADALVAVNYQLGSNWKDKFYTTYPLIKAGKYGQAIKNLKKSAWMKQTPVRVNDFIKALEGLK